VLLGFAALLVYSGYKMTRPTTHATSADANSSGSRWLPAAIRNRPFAATMLAIIVVDVAFAADSIFAAFAITTSAFPIIAANVFAVLGLRPLYVVLSDAIERFRYLRLGIGVLLVGIGVELAVEHFATVPSWVTLAAVGACLTVSIGASIAVDRRSSWAR
jgi:tellurite resistance protein TerC